MDLTSDLLVRIKNAIDRKSEAFEMPASRLAAEVARIMCEEGYLSKYEVLTRGKKKYLRVTLKFGLDKYGRPNRPVISGLKMISRSGCRVYKSVSRIPKVQSGFGTVILSTPLGVLTDREARKQKVGGEVLVYIW